MYVSEIRNGNKGGRHQTGLRFVSTLFLILLSILAPCAVAAIEVSPIGFDPVNWIPPDSRIGLKLSRQSVPGSGRLAIVLNKVDLGPLFRPISPGELSYEGSELPLPSGESELQAYWVTEDGNWEALASLPIRVLTPSGFEVAEWTPGLELSSESQFTEHPRGDIEPSQRGKSHHQEGLQMGFESRHSRGDFAIETNANFVGSSLQVAALRFNEDGEEAPKLDLSGYRVSLTKGRASLSQGDVSFGAQPLLLDNLANRGLVYRHQLTDALGFGITAQSSRGMVGVEHPLGYTEPDSRAFAATLGLQMMPQDPGRLYTELTYFSGKARSDTSFNVGEITDAVKNAGYGIRLGSKGFDGRLRGVFDYAVSTYLNPEDPNLTQGNDIVPVRETEDNAYSLNLAYDLLRDSGSTNLTISYLRNRTDPLYQALAASPLADTEAQTWRLEGALGSVGLLLEHVHSEDNLDEIATILKTRTRDFRFNLTLPLSTVLDASAREFWWSRNIGYALQRVHQVGINSPLGFDPDSHIPDQLNTLHSLNLDWSGNSWDFSYSLSVSDQDNRQAGRADADFQDLVHGLFIGLRPSDRFSVRLKLDYTRARDIEGSLEQFTHGYTLDTDWQLSDHWTLSGNYGYVKGYDSRSLELSDQTNAQTQLAWRFKLANPTGTGQLPGQLFFRHTYLDQHSENREFDFANSGDNWALHGGVSLSIF